jgi:hypothetical protein
MSSGPGATFAENTGVLGELSQDTAHSTNGWRVIFSDLEGFMRKHARPKGYHRTLAIGSDTNGPD